MTTNVPVDIFDYDLIAKCPFHILKGKDGTPTLFTGIFMDATPAQAEDLLNDGFTVKKQYYMRCTAGMFEEKMRVFLSVKLTDHSVIFIDYRKNQNPDETITNLDLLGHMIDAAQLFQMSIDRAASSIDARIKDGVVGEYDILHNNEKIVQVAMPFLYDFSAALILHCTWQDSGKTVGLSQKPFTNPSNVVICGSNFGKADETKSFSIDYAFGSDSLYRDTAVDLVDNIVPCLSKTRDLFGMTAIALERISLTWQAFKTHQETGQQVKAEKKLSPIIY